MANTKLHGRVRYEVHPDDIREAIAAHLAKKYGIAVDPERVTLCDGNKIDEYLSATKAIEVEVSP